MKDIYNDNTYLIQNPTWHEEDASFKVNKIVKLLNWNSISFKTVSEIGCGSGEILVQMESHFPEVTQFYGFDISKDAIEIAKKKETNRIKFEIKNLSDENEIGFYDLQLVIDVIEHIDNYFNFLTGIVSKSKYTIFHIPLDMCVWSLFRENMLIESKERVGHIHNFTEDFILNILTEFGFEIIDVMYTEPISNQMSTKQKFINLIRRFIFRINKKFSTKTLGGYSILVLAKNKS